MAVPSPVGWFQERFARSNRPEAVPVAPRRVPEADNRTEIISPANEQYKGRGAALRAVPKALRAVQVEPKALFQEPCGGPEAPKSRPVALRRARGAKEQAKPAAGQKPCGVFSSREHNAPGAVMAEAVND